MKGELYKEEEGYYVFVNTVILGTTRPLLNHDLVKYKLSLDNCEDIEREVPKNEFDGWDVKIITLDGVPILDSDDCLMLIKNK